MGIVFASINKLTLFSEIIIFYQKNIILFVRRITRLTFVIERIEGFFGRQKLRISFCHRKNSRTVKNCYFSIELLSF